MIWVGDARVVHTRPELFAEPHHGFAWIRMIGAVLVIYGHSSPLAGEGVLFSKDWALRPDDGVLMGFFAMSGFQITESWLRDPHLGRFAAKRVLRLWPPMLTVTLAMALVIGPLVTTLSAGDYFAAHGTWGYIVNNAGMLTLKHELPGVFTDNPWPDAVNGSLWTLPMELLAYAGLFLLLVVGAGKDKYRWITVVALVALVIWDRHLDQIPGAESAGSLLSVPVESLVAFLVAFAFGVVLNLYRIPLSPLAAGAGLVVLALMPNSIAGSFLMVFVVSYAVVLAGHYWPARLTVPGVWVNGSYGVYVWGFPIQQLLAMAGVRNQWLMLICAAPLAYVIGTLSWKFIEDPTMKLRHYLTPAPKKKDDPVDVEEPEEPEADDEPEPKPAPEATTKVTAVGRPGRRRAATPPRGTPAQDDRPPTPPRGTAAQDDRPRPPTPPRGTPVPEADRPRRRAEGADQPRRVRPVGEVKPAEQPAVPPRPDIGVGRRRRAESLPNRADGPVRPLESRNGAPQDRGSMPTGIARPPADLPPNGHQGTSEPRNGAAPGRPYPRPQRPIDAPPRRRAAPLQEDSALAKRLVGDVEPRQTPPGRPRPPARRAGTGRHARPEPPPSPDEETRPHPKHQDRR
ncbi:Peptidoglycan/LPS O-acetylase OafA/YrhL, contains acyltransferase and SGNH-hydrolase domains [Saccharopolyspora kobensis]|uniref:Peptidoglycan/LPS O-acetylase OafA/YrhL, contains acyltransferase and SGNH-hydrolase domains n=1 Tax=Saccharopolyspora kobensis TaxID=146035 RepID=A0A1H6DGW1_9PSEU|nr:acyltransferase [Saccharopolyspora kobensis]SEG84372.1 Peptidoglycan/LPS O-acetylase OafA/YrhL, contains acyltransferase and SGNH-hydrolase domains [Saccharopolyspora kobensis]SFD28427.1 Peptidoglycan/LPS O-acetylase OafA/YrhL, contains acyltransferase and SGNH-hydrolase domains [Saccharopolyspora kobensis]